MTVHLYESISPSADPPIHEEAHIQINLRVEIDESTGSAVLDFAGTGCEVRGNLNSPISVVHSAVIYSMRAMLDVDIPLNAGCLVPLESTPHSCNMFFPSSSSQLRPGFV